MSPTLPPGIVTGSIVPIRRAEELIATLPGVISVRIVPNEGGAVEEIHVLTTDLVAPKNTVRNIESALMAQLGIRVNHRKISIATTLDAPRALDAPIEAPAPAPRVVGAEVRAPSVESSFASGVAGHASIPPIVMGPPVGAAPGAAFSSVGSAPPPFVPFSGATRPESSSASAASSTVDRSAGRRLLVFEDVEVRRSRARGVLVRVTLTRDGTEHVGEAEGQETERSRIDLAARATLQAILLAVQTTPGGDRSLALEGSKLIEAFDREFVFVSVAARVAREPAVLSGVCEVRESAETSAVLAVLDATNRWVHLAR